MSFTFTVKDELSKLSTLDTEKISELSGIIHSSADIKESILISTENNSVARHIYTLIKEQFTITPKITVRRGYNYSKKMLYLLEIKQNTSTILKSLGINGETPDLFIIDDDDLIRAYLRGVFLMCASINDPKTSRYHMEFNFNTLKYAEFIKDLLNNYNLNSKLHHRDNKYMVYIKEAEKIGDFLRMVGAVKAVLYYEDIRIYRDHKNMTNRLNNCEQANVDKIIETANNQIKDITLIDKTYGIDFLSEKEQIAATYRLKYRDASLIELSEIISIETDNKITKSGLYHRFHKIKEIADKIRNKNKKDWLE